MARVIISSGHSSANPGSIANGLREVDVARQIAKATLKFLRQNGVISLSVPPEMELLQRIEWINRTGYLVKTNDIAVEIHINDGGKSGIEAWFEGDGMNASQQLSELILNSTVFESKLPSQSAKSEYKHEIGSISFIHETNTISALIECGYIDNENDANFLKDPTNIDLLGKGIARGICKFLNVDFREIAPVINNAQAVNTTPPTAQPAPSAYNRPVQQIKPTTTNAPVEQKDLQAPQQTNQQQITNTFNNNTGFATQQQAAPTSSFPAAPQASAPAGIPPATNAFQPLPSREERKQMISQNYSEILGREPTQNDLNYFLNIGIREDELIKKMIKSQEHLDLVKSKQELQTIKEKDRAQTSELMELRAGVEDQKKIIEGLNYSIMQKNTALNNFQQYFNQLQAANQQKGTTGGTPPPSNPAQAYKGTFLDRLFKAFSDLFE